MLQERSRGIDIDDDEDLTRDMKDLQPEPSVTEVQKQSVNSPATLSNNKQRGGGFESDMLPLKNNNVYDLNREIEQSVGNAISNGDNENQGNILKCSPIT